MDAGCIITHHHGCIDKAVGSQVAAHVYDFGQE
jgi:hypothetical protein